MRVHFFVPGVPVAQGSKSIIQKGGKAWMIDQKDRKLKPWRRLVAKKATEAKQRGSHIFEPLENASVSLTFCFERLKSHYTKTGKKSSKYRPFPNVKPDIDKLTRAVLDALTGVLFNDDSRVVELYARKVYGQEDGVWIFVEQAKEEVIDD